MNIRSKTIGFISLTILILISIISINMYLVRDNLIDSVIDFQKNNILKVSEIINNFLENKGRLVQDFALNSTTINTLESATETSEKAFLANQKYQDYRNTITNYVNSDTDIQY